MKYPGTKNIDGFYHKIINEIPPHKRYIELYLGSGSIMKRKLPAPKQSIGVEIDPVTIKEGQWEKYSDWYNLSILNQDVQHFLNVTARTNGIEWQKESFIYADPPYPISSRRNMNSLYRHEMTDFQHITLLKTFLKLKCNIMISTYKNPIYSKLLKDWRTVEFKIRTRAGTAVEMLYMNYPEPTQLHDYRYLGKDITQRQMIKRKIERHVDRLKKLPPLERAAAIINEILKNNTDIL